MILRILAGLGCFLILCAVFAVLMLMFSCAEVPDDLDLDEEVMP